MKKITALKNNKNANQSSYIDKKRFGGTALARERCGKADSLIVRLYEEAKGEQSGCALVAIGGYGRGELSPRSDIDLLVLHAGISSKKVEEFSKRIFYPLWDAGYQVGHSVQSVRSGVRSARADIDLLTAALDSRLLIGDERPFKSFVDGIHQVAEKGGGKPFARTLFQKREQRYASKGDSACLLEPNIKDGAGGLRDLHSVLWAAKVVYGISSLDDFYNSGHLEKDEITKLKKANDYILSVREVLHDLSGRSFDLLTFEYQEGIAEELGYEGDEAFRPVERFMRDYYLHASNIEFISNIFWSGIKHEYFEPGTRGKRLPRDMSLVMANKGYLAVKDNRMKIEDPAVFMRIMSIAATSSLDIAPSIIKTATKIARDKPESITWEPSLLDGFFAILSSGERSKEFLEMMMHIGWLDILIPEMAEKRCRPQYGSYHRYTIEEHSYHAVAVLGRFKSKYEENDDNLTNAVMKELDDPKPLYLAALLHDIGKGFEDDHSEAGARSASRIIKRMGLDSGTLRQCVKLIRLHLVLADTAMRRDIDDENLVLDLAAKIGDADTLRMLYLLTVADGMATGPEAWNAWRAILVRELFLKVLHALESGEIKKDTAAISRRRLVQLKELLVDKATESDVGRFYESMPRAYAIKNSPETMALHYGLHLGIARAKVKTLVRALEGGAYEFVVAAVDRPGLFASVTGVMSLNGFDILSAQAYSSKQGFAIEVFQVKSIFNVDPDEMKALKVEKDVKHALSSTLPLEVKLKDMLKRYPAAVTFKDFEPEVAIDNKASDFYTIIEVRAPDCLGLLHHVAGAIAEAEMDIHTAKIVTANSRILDIFYVRDLNGQKVTDNDQIATAKIRILGAIQACKKD